MKIQEIREQKPSRSHGDWDPLQNGRRTDAGSAGRQRAANRVDVASMGAKTVKGAVGRHAGAETGGGSDEDAQKSVEDDKAGPAETVPSPGIPGIGNIDSGRLKLQAVATGDEDFKYTDMHLNKGVDSDADDDEIDEDDDDDDVSLALSGECLPCTTEDESHYITTHEIQLSELSDHEGDYETGTGSSGWDVEDDNQVYSFVDYASFEGDGATKAQSHRARLNGAGLESDPRRNGSDETLSKTQNRGSATGQIHLSIKTTSRAINDPGSSIKEEENILYRAERTGDVSRYVLRGADGKTEKAKRCIAVPRSLHFGGKLKGKELRELSSGTSSAVSELDDADKEVRNLTAKTFKSLAYPYFDAINFSTSGESSASERGLGINRWSAFVDLKYGDLNVSRGIDQSIVTHKNSTSSFGIAQNLDGEGRKCAALASIETPPGKIFTLNSQQPGASSSTKKIELMGKFGHGRGGVITLTETLNFRCNVKSGMPEAVERRAKYARNAPGSRSTDGVTDSVPDATRRGASKAACNAGDTMEDTHKKAIFASSLIKNVISKKMQFEQERKMERGEIREPRRARSPRPVRQGKVSPRESWELQRQGSKLSDTSSDFAFFCVDELGDIVDSGSCSAKSDGRRRESDLESADEAGIDAKKGAYEAAKGTLLRSQYSAFRSWREAEIEFHKEHKNDRTPEERLPASNDSTGERDPDPGDSKLTKMSHLFVPSIQLLPSDGEVGKQLQTRNYSVRVPVLPCKGGRLEGWDFRPVATSKSPEIKINLRSVRDNAKEAFGIGKPRPPDAGGNSTQMRTDDFRCQALAAALKGECSDKVPHFTVRDIRDNKGKLQTPIHQVRDVRKLVKSSYHFVSLDNSENKTGFNADDAHTEQKKQVPHRNPVSVSPIVIKCQSVNTNSNGKPSENRVDSPKRGFIDDPCNVDRSSPDGAKCSSPLAQRPHGKLSLGYPNKGDVHEGDIGSKIETRSASHRLEKTADFPDNKPESNVANQVALEKLQAAVKTMEQLYVFDRNEWKRKSEPQPLSDSHVLSLITCAQHRVAEERVCGVSALPRSNIHKLVRRESYPNTERNLPAVMDGKEKGSPQPLQDAHSHQERPGVMSLAGQGAGTTGGKNVFKLNMFDHKTTSGPTTESSGRSAFLPSSVTQTAYGAKGFVPKSPKLPVSLKISQKKHRVETNEKQGVAMQRSSQNNFNALAVSENYLTIPAKSPATSGKTTTPAGLGHDKMVYTITATGGTSELAATGPQKQPGPQTNAGGGETCESNQSPSCFNVVMDSRCPEIPPATSYHSLPLSMSAGQPQMYCFSPTITPTPVLDPFQAVQRKMLLDPSTGNYYLVDTPVQPTTKRLFDPETGQYVDVPVPQSPMTPVPMSMSMSPLALSPGAYGHTYMICPGFLPAPAAIPTRTLTQSQMSVQCEAEGVEKSPSQQMEGIYVESPYYVAAERLPQTASMAQQLADTVRPAPGSSSSSQPFISIPSQQWPRIVAPPRFDGTTMSFVVEHR